MKWSDGKPFTADDIVFAIEDCCKNTELYKSVPSPLVIANKPGQAIKVDDATVKFIFASPYALFLEQLATPLGQHPTLFPKHYVATLVATHLRGLLAEPRYTQRAAEVGRMVQAEAGDQQACDAIEAYLAG